MNSRILGSSQCGAGRSRVTHAYSTRSSTVGSSQCGAGRSRVTHAYIRILAWPVYTHHRCMGARTRPREIRAPGLSLWYLCRTRPRTHAREPRHHVRQFPTRSSPRRARAPGEPTAALALPGRASSHQTRTRHWPSPPTLGRPTDRSACSVGEPKHGKHRPTHQAAQRVTCKIRGSKMGKPEKSVSYTNPIVDDDQDSSSNDTSKVELGGGGTSEPASPSPSSAVKLVSSPGTSMQQTYVC